MGQLGQSRRHRQAFNGEVANPFYPAGQTVLAAAIATMAAVDSHALTLGKDDLVTCAFREGLLNGVRHEAAQLRAAFNCIDRNLTLVPES